MVPIDGWIVVLLLCSGLLSLGIWLLLTFALPMLKIPYGRLSLLQVMACYGVCWGLGVGPEFGWYAVMLFLLLLQPALTLLLFSLWLFIQRIQRCDPLRERI